MTPPETVAPAGSEPTGEDNGAVPPSSGLAVPGNESSPPGSVQPLPGSEPAASPSPTDPADERAALLRAVVGASGHRWADGEPLPPALARALAALDEHAAREAARQQRELAEREQAAREYAAELARANGALFRTVEALATEQSMDAFLDATLRTVATTLGADSVTMWLWRHGSACLHHVFDAGEVVPGDRAAHPDACRPLPLTGNPWAQGVLAGREPMEEVTSVPERMCWTPAGVDYLRGRGVRAVVNAAIRIGRTVVGSFSVPLTENQPDPGPEAMALVRSLANQSALALELTRLTEAVHAGAVLEERNRLARDLHDMLSQSFAGIIAQLGGAEGALDAGETDTLRRCLERAMATARASLQEARRAVHALRPGFLAADTPLERAFEQVLAQMTVGTELRGTLRTTGTVFPLGATLVEALVRIVQELLANTLHHAARSARTFVLDLAWGETTLRLEARDDGPGFDPAARTDGFGLGGIRERVVALGGRFELHAGIGRGTAVVVELPLDTAGTDGEAVCHLPMP